MKDLKEILGEMYEPVLAKLGTTKILIDDGTFVPNHRLSEVIADKKLAMEQVKKYEEDLKVLKELGRLIEGVPQIQEQQNEHGNSSEVDGTAEASDN